MEEPSIEDACQVLMGVKGYYEGYHGVTVPDELIGKIVRLSERYVTDRFLPDKAIDLLDESCACASLENKAVDDLYLTNQQIAAKSVELEELEADVEHPDYEKQAIVKADIEKYKKQAETLYGPASNRTVTEKDVAKVIELWTGIPATKIEESELHRLADLENALNQ